jgi:Zn-dependent protease
MLRAFPIGRIFGIRLDVHASWLPIFALVAVTLASVVPPAAAVAGALLLFASVVVHELAHALVARRFGVETRAISLFLFGGVATLEAEPPSPSADALVALAGPAMSAAIAAAAYGAMLAAGKLLPLRDADAVTSVLAYVTVANAVLAGFNLIPAYPMDGGRVLRALLWRLRRDRDGATATAALVGMAFALGFAAAGLAAVALTRTWQFAWYTVVAAFLLRSCFTQYRALRRPPAIPSLSRDSHNLALGKG